MDEQAVIGQTNGEYSYGIARIFILFKVVKVTEHKQGQLNFGLRIKKIYLEITDML